MLPTAFEPISFKHQQAYQKLFANVKNSFADICFTNIWAWAQYYALEWKQSYGLCWLRQTRAPLHDSPIYWPPVGNWHEVNWKTIPELAPGTVFERIPEDIVTLWDMALPNRLQVEETPDQWEYLYHSLDLSTLAGNRLHKKRNHVNGFIKEYCIDYRSLSEKDVPALRLFQNAWFSSRQHIASPSLIAETKAVHRILDSWSTLGNLVGGALYVDDSMVAFTVGEALNSDTMVVHLEKGRTEYRGVYQAINYFFCQAAMAQGFTVINREQDAGEDGLRKAKLSYLPIGFIKKYRVTVL